ncbi:hypothetical protein JSCD14_32290 [Clostridioides difficile]|nr:hypothetical protein TNHP173_24370 [Clostridioides difficile]GMK61867.1 hypothetical protein JSCD1_17510 [Clostridioides difficile]GMK65399.1 hypothetical protein JSCD2_17310 [Clostridioides difficile]GMK69111.1 hypothetical protein JSCD3_19050 [Clostridioides difficile]GMK73552.1 hypothetical protein JSCD4_27240 [Clostridioides difficile]
MLYKQRLTDYNINKANIVVVNKELFNYNKTSKNIMKRAIKYKE